jgi:hypothetical protein
MLGLPHTSAAAKATAVMPLPAWLHHNSVAHMELHAHCGKPAAAVAVAAVAVMQMRETALIRAAHNGHLSVVEHLLQSGADIGAHDLVCGAGYSC